MKRTSFLALFALVAIAAIANPSHSEEQTPFDVGLSTSGNLEANTAHTVLPDRGDSVRRITDITKPRLKVFTSTSTNARPAPAILIFPGGGYQYLAINKEGTEIAEWLNTLGIIAVVVEYSVPGNREQALKDAQQAIAFVRENSDAWNVRSESIGALGFSAGGHLVTQLCTSQNWQPDFCMMVYPAYLTDSSTNELAAEIADKLVVASQAPTTFIAHAKDDGQYVAGSIAYHKALQNSGMDSTLHLFENGGHGHGLRFSAEAMDVSRWPMLAEAWLEEIGVLMP